MRLGPITILSTKRAKAYADLHYHAALLHRDLWYSEDFERDRQQIMADVMVVGESLSHLPDPLVAST